ncbi:hypothetical protein [Sabulicella rubraurantiaca]|uniref:hypothetical protein n=1 Tax=Sabulicella rubraurantiaca TaxID=2811429 RepID=UPI001A95A5FF|nr:hypothetical protein [Sabulicella rubraurantiaca]
MSSDRKSVSSPHAAQPAPRRIPAGGAGVPAPRRAKDAFQWEEESNALWRAHREEYLRDSNDEALALASMPLDARKDAFEKVKRNLAPLDRERVKWTIDRPEDVPMLDDGAFPELDRTYCESLLGAVQDSDARLVLRFLLDRDEAITSPPEHLIKTMATAKPAGVWFPRAVLEGSEARALIECIRVHRLLENRLKFALEGEVLDQLSHSDALTLLCALAPPRESGHPAREPKLLGGLLRRVAPFEGLLHRYSEPYRFAQARPKKSLPMQMLAFLRHVPAKLAVHEDVPSEERMEMEQADLKTEEQEIHDALCKADAGPAPAFLSAWLRHSPRLHFTQSADWRKRVEFRVAQASLAAEMTAAEAAILGVAWEILGLTTPEGRFQLGPVTKSCGKKWWKGSDGPVLLGSYLAAVRQWHYQDPIWGPVLREMLEAAEASHKGWMRRLTAVRSLRRTFEKTVGRQFDDYEVALSRASTVSETLGTQMAWGVRRVEAQISRLDEETALSNQKEAKGPGAPWA